jgi:hypothetical protein
VQQLARFEGGGPLGQLGRGHDGARDQVLARAVDGQLDAAPEAVLRLPDVVKGRQTSAEKFFELNIWKLCVSTDD